MEEVQTVSATSLNALDKTLLSTCKQLLFPCVNVRVYYVNETVHVLDRCVLAKCHV